MGSPPWGGDGRKGTLPARSRMPSAFRPFGLGREPRGRVRLKGRTRFSTREASGSNNPWGDSLEQERSKKKKKGARGGAIALAEARKGRQGVQRMMSQFPGCPQRRDSPGRDLNPAWGERGRHQSQPRLRSHGKAGLVSQKGRGLADSTAAFRPPPHGRRRGCRREGVARINCPRHRLDPGRGQKGTKGLTDSVMTSAPVTAGHGRALPFAEAKGQDHQPWP